MLRWVVDHIAGIPAWLASFQHAGQLVFVAVITSFVTACVTEPVKQFIAEHRRKQHWRQLVYSELALIYAAILWELDEAVNFHPGGAASDNNVDAALEEKVCEPFRTPHFDMAKTQPGFYELPEASTIELLYDLVARTYGGGRQKSLFQETYHHQVRGIITQFRSCLFPKENYWAWQINAFHRPIDRPLDAVLFYRCLSRQDLKKELWALEGSDRVLGRPPKDYRDGDGIYSKGQLLQLPFWQKALFRGLMHFANALRKLLIRLGLISDTREKSNGSGQS